LLRQIDKSNNNSIGYFNQNIFKYFGNGWTVPEKGSKVSNEKIRLISIDKFYSLVTGDSNSFAKLCEILPQVIDDVVSNTLEVSNDDLARILRPYTDMENPLLSIYIKAFKTFEGFNNFEFSKD